MPATTRKKGRTLRRDAKTGRTVSKKFAQENPDSTVTETSVINDAKKFLSKLKDGGAIVRTSDLSQVEVIEARNEGRVWDEYVYVPIEP